MSLLGAEQTGTQMEPGRAESSAIVEEPERVAEPARTGEFDPAEGLEQDSLVQRQVVEAAELGLAAEVAQPGFVAEVELVG